MPNYRQPGIVKAARLTQRADELVAAGSSQGNTSDKYIRTTVFLASVLFLIGISSHFPLRGARLGLVGPSTGLLILSLVLFAQLPRPH
jgi:hypothetical protein